MPPSSRGLDCNFFLSLPLATPALTAALDAWRDTVLAEPGAAASGACELLPLLLLLVVAAVALPNTVPCCLLMLLQAWTPRASSSPPTFT